MSPKANTQQKSADVILRRLVWLYIILVVTEGALRKWFLPSFSDSLLIIRDPIALFSYAVALHHKCFPLNRFILVGLSLGVMMSLTTILFGHGNWLIAAFGFRVNILHFPFAFIMGRVLYRSDVVEIGKWWLWTTIPMTIILALQFELPQSAWINQSIGGKEGIGFTGGMGRFRPTGTFSFTNGTTLFYTFAIAFLMGGLTQHKRYSKLLLGLSSIAILLALPLSISRSMLLISAFIVLVGLLCTAMQKMALMRYARILLALAAGLFIANQIPIFDDAKDAFLARWEKATNIDHTGIRDSILMRTFNMFADPLLNNDDATALGVGLGAGTNVGSKLLTGERQFLHGESEWHRIIGESGFILGLSYILWRVWLVVRLTRLSIRTLLKGNGLPVILLACNGFNILIAQIGQTTVYGFTIVGIGITIAAMRQSPQIAQSTKITPQSPITDQ